MFSITAYFLQSNSITHSSTTSCAVSSPSLTMGITFSRDTRADARCAAPERTLLDLLTPASIVDSLATRSMLASDTVTFLPPVMLRMAAARYFARLVGSWHSQLMIFISCSSFSSPCMARTWWVSSASSSLVSSAATIREPSPSSALREKVPLSAAYAKTISSGKNMKVIMPSSGSTTCGDQMSSTTMSQKYARMDHEAVTQYTLVCFM
mmetsp:Transcript_87863/g.248849  ORF Transcript_87863/g.248849 Transcript_87863/m.248849 type:complete len:209 (-) Transcript_87863:537-1163(-)